MYDFGLTCDILSPELDAAALWSGAAAPAIAFFRERIGAGRIPFFRPSAAGCWNETRGPLHRYRSEIFFQVQGSCRFAFPAETVTIRPGDVLLVPLGMPHVEHAAADGGKPFFNLVLMVAERYTTLHIGAVCAGDPHSDRPEVLIQRPLPNPVFYRGAVMALSQFSSRPRGADDAAAALLEALLRQMAADLSEGALPEAADAA
ncbi:MAG: AraC family ligand binding domain-containing protein, partial [Lentisphaeria bacterium]|nr:AraC family ligand binding domain-containing protein [Lentisphaeria bacterium]